MNQPWRQVIEDILADEIGILAGMVIDEILEDIGLTEKQLNRRHGGKFVKRLIVKLPPDVQEKALLKKVTDALLKLPA